MKNENTADAKSVPSRHWMDKYGIKFEERLTVTKAQLELKMRPCYTLKTRIWAYLILHTAGYQGERAQMMKGGHQISVQPPDISDALQQSAAKYYRDAGVTLDKAALNKLRPTAQDMRRALADMEEDGICERQYDGRPLKDMTIKERQAKLNGKIDLYVWLKPRKPDADNVRQEWNQSQVSEVPPPEFSNKQIINYLKSGIPKLSILLRHLEPAQQERVSEAWKQFAEVVNSCLPTENNERLPEAVIEAPPFIREEIEEEKVVSEQPPPPPENIVATDGRMRMEFPLTIQELRKKDPAVKEAFVRRLFRDTYAYCQKHPDFPAAKLAKLTDQSLAAMCKESFATGPAKHGIGLLLSRVPAIAITWSQEIEDGSIRQSA